MESCFKFSSLSKFPELIHGISTRSYGNMNFKRGSQGKVEKNREHFLAELGIKIDDVVVPEIIHGERIHLVGATEKGRGARVSENDIKNADGLISKEKGIFLMVTAADCFPILMYDPINQVVGALHCGWRSIMAGIIDNLFKRFEGMDVQSQNLLVAVGPGICQRHFIVRNEVLKNFAKVYPAATLVRNKDGYVDLRKAIIEDLTRFKVPQENIEVSSSCPVCDNGIFGSHRAEGDSAPVSAAVIGMRS